MSSESGDVFDSLLSDIDNMNNMLAIDVKNMDTAALQDRRPRTQRFDQGYMLFLFSRSGSTPNSNKVLIVDMLLLFL